MYTRILVALDGSKQSESVLGRAGVLAAKHNAELVLLMVLPMPMVVIENGRMIATIDQEAERMQTLVQPYLRKWKARFEGTGIGTSVAVRFGDTAQQIADYAAGHRIDLIVVPEKARKGFDRWLHPSLAEKVVHLAPTPVILMNAA
ncbi:MAG: universal stress protein [Chloroflexi bacterium]|nr:universal stress protein [Chloroflexota bacterium]